MTANVIIEIWKPAISLCIIGIDIAFIKRVITFKCTQNASDFDPILSLQTNEDVACMDETKPFYVDSFGPFNTTFSLVHALIMQWTPCNIHHTSA